MGIIYFLIISIIAAKKGLECLSGFFFKALGIYAVILALADLGRWPRYAEVYDNPSVGSYLAECLIAAAGGLIAYFVFYFIFKLLFKLFRK